MARKKGPANPFYTLLVLAGVALVITILAQLVSLYTLDPLAEYRDASALARFFHRWGNRLLFWEIAVLVAASVLAMALDRWRSWRDESRGNGAKASELERQESR